ncbi:uncharacterized protein LOC110976650 [Acanthaster planci]|uniref:Uncharacterized protein LOC110976650 n=1 Tax=Acanthaster planci TaxID=133434 RepID=A0A8B7XY37_ACAPL|nr:uncharacterized protein LOC110976650 [Acanthaster planci]
MAVSPTYSAGDLSSDVDIISTGRPNLVRIKFGNSRYLATDEHGRIVSDTIATNSTADRTVWYQTSDRFGGEEYQVCQADQQRCDGGEFLAVRRTNGVYNVCTVQSCPRNCTVFLWTCT